MYTLELELTFVNCPQDVEACIQRQKCSVSIWEQPWLQKREVTKLNCKELKSKTALSAKSSSRRHLFGGVTPVDPSSDEIQANARVALQAIQAQSNARNLLNIVNVRHAATQVVAGKKVYLTIEVGQTDCLSSEHWKSSCPFNETADRQLCKVEIWIRPWLNESQVTSLKCVPISSKVRCNATNCKRSRRSTDNAKVHMHHHHKHLHRSRNLKKSHRLKHMTAFRSYAKQFGKIYKTWDEFQHRYKIYRYKVRKYCA